MIFKCKGNCVHPMQDAMYGQGVRVLNHLDKVKNRAEEYYKCTVCGRIHSPAEVVGGRVITA